MRRNSGRGPSSWPCEGETLSINGALLLESAAHRKSGEDVLRRVQDRQHDGALALVVEVPVQPVRRHTMNQVAMMALDR